MDTVQLRMGQEVQVFIFARFVHIVSCSKVADGFVHHTERSTEQQGSLFEQQRDFDSMHHEDPVDFMCFYALSF